VFYIFSESIASEPGLPDIKREDRNKLAERVGGKEKDSKVEIDSITEAALCNLKPSSVPPFLFTFNKSRVVRHVSGKL